MFISKNTTIYSSNNAIRSLNLKRSERFLSSFSYLNNNPLLRKSVVNNSKIKIKNPVSKLNHKIGNSERLFYSQKLQLNKYNNNTQLNNDLVVDYSWLPKVPSNKRLTHQDITTDIFYSGFRPLSIDPTELENKDEDSSTWYEVSLTLDSPVPPSGHNSIWTSSATGMERYREWHSVPEEVINSLTPFQPPDIDGNVKSQVIKEASNPKPKYSFVCNGEVSGN
ncbi:hypothetical protein Kpol_1072p12 [Vanderwaltozyma polyspora DSM 70294]|uniref:Uncharacterized protein n=1 Tax=Vanderwaltozyma polyspora (strain ATCC 22028 / DSM 70294 / BCRC 21397 / CBS 2163 / NBRC 10782 / NRRL Y-8283 / UCD 57-17) TaxID=436907 RepID=A7TKN0_VANPO|nr:uncharacterized protein Kpol_1072p12 [Vanderwaltozyma polyspora DSM 70294]EDO17142.1 hypothetical protein Kpol_1072p12 [Vanderwaltozyma polyspora DSM 70294]